MKKINLFVITLILSSTLFISNSNAFLYGSIFSLESLNVAKANNIELSPAYNSRIICLARKQEYNKKFPKYIRSTCFKKEWDLNKYYYLICDSNSFTNCDVDLYLWSPMNINILKPVAINVEKIIEKEQTKEMVNKIYDSVANILSNQKPEQLSQRSQEAYNIVDDYIAYNWKNLDKLKGLNDYIKKIERKQKKNSIISLKKHYKLKEIRFINTSNNTYYSIQDFFAKRVPDKYLDQIKKVKVVFENTETGQSYTLKITFWDDASIADYNVDDVITWIFTDTVTGKDYNIDDIITKIFTEDSGNSDDEMSLDKILNLVFNWPDANNIVTNSPDPEVIVESESAQEDISFNNLMKMILWDI